MRGVRGGGDVGLPVAGGGTGGGGYATHVSFFFCLVSWFLSFFVYLLVRMGWVVGWMLAGEVEMRAADRC